MPAKAKSETQYSRRNEVVRERVNGVLRALRARADVKLEGGYGAIVPESHFSMRCFEIVERDPTHRWLKNKSDATASVRNFASGKRDWYLHLLDTAELACMEFEREFKFKAEFEPNVFKLNTVKPQGLYESAGVFGTPVLKQQPVVYTHTVAAEKDDEVDPELDAIAKCSAILKSLEKVAQVRALSYMMTRLAGSS